MVAAAGATEGLRPGAAWGLFAFFAVALVLSGVAATRESVLGWVELDRSPEALAERARQAVAAAGERAAVADEAWGFGRGVSALEWLAARGEPATRWDPLATGRLGAITFWYRGAPRELTPANVVGRVGPDDPPPEAMSGDAVVFLDERGRLTSLTVTPGQVLPEGTAPREPDWGPLFALAGLDPATFSRVQPLWAPPVWADTTAAWSGRFPEIPDAQIRVEGAAARGAIVHFDVVRPWDRPARVAPRQPTLGERIIQNVNIAIVVATLLGAAFVARRDVASGRADSRGSWRLGAWATVATLGQWACFANHQTSASREWGLFIQGAGLSLFVGALAAVLYLALEPLVRRIWPDVLISWTRLISGRWRDPIVARDALVGFTAASALAAVAAAVAFTQRALGSPAKPAIPDLDGALGLPGWIGQMFGVQVNAVVSPMVILLVLVSARSLLRTTPRAVAVGLLVLGPLFVLAAMQGGGGLPFLILGLLRVGVIFVVLVRFGLLALVVTILTGQIVTAFSWLADVGAWYWGFAAAAHGLILVLAAGAALTASRRAPARA